MSNRRRTISQALVMLPLLLAATAFGQVSSRVNVPHAPAAEAPAGVPAPGAGGCARSLSACYYDLCEFVDDEAPIGDGGVCLGQGDPDQVPPILAAGHSPVYIDNLDATTLLRCDILFAQNESNGGYNQEWIDALPAIAARVQSGMILVFHDRAVDDEEVGGGGGAPTGSGTEVPGNAADYIPGLAGASCARDFNDDANIEVVTAGTAVTDGPAGTIDDSSLDGGNSSSHGYCTQVSLPGGSTSFLSRTLSTEAVAFAYPYGAGTVYYSTMPLDFYLDGEGNEPPLSNYANIYAPNVLTYAGQVSPACLPTLVAVPTLSAWGLAALAALLGLGSVWMLRRRTRAQG